MINLEVCSPLVGPTPPVERQTAPVGGGGEVIPVTIPVTLQPQSTACGSLTTHLLSISPSVFIFGLSGCFSYFCNPAPQHRPLCKTVGIHASPMLPGRLSTAHSLIYCTVFTFALFHLHQNFPPNLAALFFFSFFFQTLTIYFTYNFPTKRFRVI